MRIIDKTKSQIELQVIELEDFQDATLNIMSDLDRGKKELEKSRLSLEEQKKDLERANLELDSFVYTASHDLRAPLRGIISFAGFLEEDYKDKLDNQGKDYINEIKKGIKRMEYLINDLLTLSRISRIQNPYEDIDIYKLINLAKDRIEFDLNKYNVVFKVQENLPVVYCDCIKMTEVVVNLINNAIKFSSKEKPQNPYVEIGYLDEKDFHKFYVKDNGIGIDSKYHTQIFELFSKLHPVSEYEGTGAGLCIVKRIIEGHSGKVWVESEPNKGATFFFTIPKDLKEKDKTEEK